MFAGYGALMAAAFVAAIFARQPTLRYAMSLITLSWFLTRLWRMGLPEFTFGYALIDAAMLAAFVHRWRTQHSAIAFYLAVIQLSFLAWHLLGTLINFDGIRIFGDARGDYYVEALVRNLLFLASLLLIITAAAIRIALMRSALARAFAARIVRRGNFLKRESAAIFSTLMKKFALVMRTQRD